MRLQNTFSPLHNKRYATEYKIVEDFPCVQTRFILRICPALRKTNVAKVRTFFVCDSTTQITTFRRRPRVFDSLMILKCRPSMELIPSKPNSQEQTMKCHSIKRDIEATWSPQNWNHLQTGIAQTRFRCSQLGIRLQQGAVKGQHSVYIQRNFELIPSQFYPETLEAVKMQG